MPTNAFMFRNVTAAGSGTLPVSGALVWLKPDPATMFTSEIGGSNVASDGDNVKRWEDQSGNGLHFTAATAPFYRPGVTNRGMPVVGFENRSMTIPAGVATALIAATEGEWFLVIKNLTSNTTANRGFHTMGSSGSSTNLFFSNGLLYDDWGSTTRKDGIDPGQDLSDAFSVYNSYSKTNDYKIFLDTVQLYTSASNTVGFPSGAQHLGDSAGVSINAYIQEVVIFPSKLSSGDRTAMNTYLTT